MNEIKELFIVLVVMAVAVYSSGRFLWKKILLAHQTIKIRRLSDRLASLKKELADKNKALSLGCGSFITQSQRVKLRNELIALSKQIIVCKKKRRLKNIAMQRLLAK